MSAVKNVVIAAAGAGTRLGLECPKCPVRVNCKTILEYQLTYFLLAAAKVINRRSENWF